MFTLHHARDGKHKYVAFFNIDGHTKRVPFGAFGYSDFTEHRDEDRKYRYLKRHYERENWNDPYTAGALSRWLLWNRPTLQESLREFKEYFDL